MLRPKKKPETKGLHCGRDPLHDHNYVKNNTNYNNDYKTLEDFLQSVDNEIHFGENVDSDNGIGTQTVQCIKHEQNEHSEIQENLFVSGDMMADLDYYSLNDDEIEVIRCEYCAIKFENMVDLQLHVEQEHEYLDIKPEMFQCNRCPHTFINETDMLDHLKSEHSSLNCIKQSARNNKIVTDEIGTIEIETNIRCGSDLLTGMITVNDFIDISVEKYEDMSDISEENDWHIIDENITNHSLVQEPNQISTQIESIEDIHVNTDDRTHKENIAFDHPTQNKKNCGVEKTFTTSDELSNFIECECDDCSSTFINKEVMMQHNVQVLHGNFKERLTKSKKSSHYLKELLDNETKDNQNAGNTSELQIFSTDNNISFYNQLTNSHNESKIPTENEINVTKQRFDCTICNKDYSYKHWKSHLKEVHSQDEYICMICDVKFKCKRYLKRHFVLKHEGVLKACDRKKLTKNEEFNCSQCPRVLPSQEALGRHLNNCHGTPAKCNICDSVLKSESYLIAHMRRVHYDDGNMHKCNICAKELRSARQLNIHIRNNHPETLIPCPFCKKTFLKVWQLKSHMTHCTEYKNIIEESAADENVDVE